MDEEPSLEDFKNAYAKKSKKLRLTKTTTSKVLGSMK